MLASMAAVGVNGSTSAILVIQAKLLPTVCEADPPAFENPGQNFEFEAALTATAMVAIRRGITLL